MYDTKNTIHNLFFFPLYIGSWIYKTVLHKKLLFDFHLHHINKSEQPVLSQIERPYYSGLLLEEQTNIPDCHCGVISSGLYWNR